MQLRIPKRALLPPNLVPMVLNNRPPHNRRKRRDGHCDYSVATRTPNATRVLPSKTTPDDSARHRACTRARSCRDTPPRHTTQHPAIRGDTPEAAASARAGTARSAASAGRGPIETMPGDRSGVRGEWEPDELIGAWTLVEGDWELAVNKTGATRLGSR
jgi:hypothetical protein